MKPTINDYIKASFVERAEAEELKRKVIDNLHNQVADRITFSLPPAIIYSADISHSFIVLESPLFSNMGFFVFPSSLRSSKFCIFLAPT